MTLHVAIDFGTSSTCTAVATGEHAGGGSEPQVVVVDGQPLVPSAVFAAADGTLFVGHEAERQAAVDPSRYEPHPKRRIDEGELLLGSTVLPVREVIRAVLSRAVGEARRVAGGAPVDLLVLTHPADWGAMRTHVLRQAASGLAAEIALVPEPVAAAVFHSAGHGMADGAALAVLDLGGGTVDCSVVRRQSAPSAHDPGRPVPVFQVLATRGDPTFGGADIDQALLEHVGGLVAGTDPEAWRRLVEGRDLADRRRRRVLRQDVRGAKETLSRHAYTDVPMPPPFPDAHVTRADLEGLVAGPLSRAAELVVATVRDAGLTPQQLSGVFLVGGSSRIPLVSRLVYERTGLMPITLDQPETVVARGALRAVTRDPDRTAGLPPAASAAGASHPPRPGTPAVGLPAGSPASGPFPSVGGAAGPNLRPVPGTPPAGFTPPGGFGAPGLPPAPTPPTPPAAPAPRRRAPLLVGGAVVLVAVIATVLGVTLSGSGDEGDRKPQAAQGREIAQYDYRFRMPADWEQTGGDAGQRKVQVKPTDAAVDTDLIAVQEFKLNYDSDADRGRALRQLRAEFDRSTSRGFSDFEEKASFAGRDVVHYRQQRESTTVDWYVLFRGTTQVAVGCQYTEGGRSRVAGACDEVVRTLEITG
ncbi:type VII secretion-associated protein, Rv3446c family, C-terminal domain-containing protein [Streptoalloteichus tenebrarius]|uniref:Type VII secretion-associated protein, Rv3446c family, C-terminal domain-containing protein n=1 Tax=Streptoalloteichus tenebrarius (strain ATCC 17920 / DSM 40477 / JCM 4838 / CBS 697.72 / NBRC 16177 / NCIMB 11028 / NRRL B-12390 / A12253. 1 / ISP 5477) TaxID=1933 RepID=A0ABT1HXF6_STRSD|nr:type VII secretion-associated protein [Streptoalloteichus tenebrarius]MCP2260207.1 type VII secretion-associated protein, Rv3446c family, C-terminal domain-containing protein [Streptoalloteichus tenebrarius]BFF02591.1 type VII secretion-associated protein [Streptoalloteichus tenebrarius]